MQVGPRFGGTTECFTSVPSISSNSYLCTILTKAWTNWMNGSWPSWLILEPGVGGLAWVEGRMPLAGDDGEPRRKCRDRLERRVLWGGRERTARGSVTLVLLCLVRKKKQPPRRIWTRVDSPARSWAPVWASACRGAGWRDLSDIWRPERSARRSSSPWWTSAETWGQTATTTNCWVKIFQ